jgi:calcium-dependent protein kinase
MAPEVLSSQVVPASDLWSAGVMAHQLLTGRLPFDDHKSPSSPSISAIWRSVLCDRVNYGAPWWRGISEDAKDFVEGLLNR